MAAILLGAVITVNSQEKEKDVIWESITITPDNTKLKILSENMRKHNQKYHNDGVYKSQVFNIITGPNIGKIVWEMGPLTFSHLDGRPSDGDHDDDWRDNIMPYVKKMTHGEYWRQNTKLSNVSMLTGDFTHPLLYVRYFEVEKGQGHNMNGLFKKISKTVKALEGENPWGLYYNLFRQGDRIGRHVATVSFYKNWAHFDKDEPFKKTFLKEHGENSWEGFVKGMENTFSNSWDEMWMYNKNLSGH